VADAAAGQPLRGGLLDALIVKIRDANTVRNHACYLAIGVNLEGTREVLGIWFQRTEGAKFWLHVLTELRKGGIADILICCVDGLTGFPEAIEAVFPQTIVQTCLVHLVRHSLRFVPYKDRRQVAGDLKLIYTAPTQDAAADALTAFAERWDDRFPSISRSWLEHWEHITPFLAFPPDVRRGIYTTDENVKGAVGQWKPGSGGWIGRGRFVEGRRRPPVASVLGSAPLSGRLRACGGVSRPGFGCARASPASRRR
jgi:hypothetical protein